jgi:hypothetical protein
MFIIYPHSYAKTRKKYLIGGINFGVINSGEGKGDGSIFVNLFCPEQGST